MDKLWKAAERKFATMLGGERKPINGREGSDIEHRWLSPEVKVRSASIPRYILDWITQAVRGALVDQKKSRSAHLGVVIWHQKGAPYDEAIVMLRLSDFMDWFVGEAE